MIEAAPAVTRVLVLRDTSMSPAGLSEAEATARALLITLEIIEANNPDQFGDAFAAAVARGANGVATFASPFFNYDRKRLIELASRYRLPSIWEATAYVRDGGLLSYGPSFADMYRRSAGYVAKLLNGVKTSDLPVEQPAKFELGVNLNIATALGLAISATQLARADEVIE
ncbi:hypothetical protein JQ586_37480 [Bradyrhizobium jicamae]|nr:hypothetical protein [Bradyrhizobium jicamae]